MYFKINSDYCDIMMTVVRFPGEWLLCSSRVIRVWSQCFLHQKWTSWGSIREQEGTEVIFAAEMTDRIIFD